MGTKQLAPRGAAPRRTEYDPFLRGRFPVGVRTIEARDEARDRVFPIEIWYPAAARYAGQDIAPATQDVFAVPSGGAKRSQLAVRNAAAESGTYELIVFCHASGHHRRGAAFLCTHLSSHGYVVAALDHSEVVAADLRRRDGETAAEKAARTQAVIASRVPDVRFLLDHLLDGRSWDSEAELDPARIGILGHSFGGWTALAAPGMRELFERTPGPKQMVVLSRADHAHFMDAVEEEHETARCVPWSGELAWIAKELRPIAELCSGEQAHVFVRGLPLCHMDAILRQREIARRFLASDVEAELATRGVAASVHKPSASTLQTP